MTDQERGAASAARLGELLEKGRALGFIAPELGQADNPDQVAAAACDFADSAAEDLSPDDRLERDRGIERTRDAALRGIAVRCLGVELNEDARDIRHALEEAYAAGRVSR